MQKFIAIMQSESGDFPLLKLEFEMASVKMAKEYLKKLMQSPANKQFVLADLCDGNNWHTITP